MALLKSLWCLLACLAVVSCNTTLMEITMATTTTTSIASTPAASATATTTTGAVVPGPAATTTSSAQGAATATATPAQGAATTTPGQGAATTTTAAAAMSSMPFVINPTATSTPASSSVIAAACVPSNQTSCVASKCCLGNSGAWSGVDKTKKLPYNETTCPPSGQLLVAREKTCVEVCVNKECDGSGANGLMIQGTTLLLSLFAFWVITYD